MARTKENKLKNVPGVNTPLNTKLTLVATMASEKKSRGDQGTFGRLSIAVRTIAIIVFIVWPFKVDVHHGWHKHRQP